MTTSPSNPHPPADAVLRALAATALATGFLMPGAANAAAQSSVAEARRVVAAAAQHGAPWNGPHAGPRAQSSKTVVIVAEDLRNGGVVGAAQGMREAAKVLGWNIRIMDAGGTAAGRTRALASALAASPDGLVLCGSDAVEANPELAAFTDKGIPIVGWHAGPAPGPIAGTPVATNVTTDPLEVARVTAMDAVAQSEGHAGVVIFTDSRFRIAMAKADAMAAVIRACDGCAVLEIRDVALSDADTKMPGVVRNLLQHYGRRWTHALAINDVVFDRAVPVLTSAGLQGPSLLSAGDGSAAAFLRIQARTFQTGTVAEPLNQQGWQALDELNRLFAHQPASGFVAPVHLVTSDNIAFDGGPRLQYDPDNGYREIYRRIWQR
jgi:ribose transport system substrate-binding protein